MDPNEKRLYQFIIETASFIILKYRNAKSDEQETSISLLVSKL